ncbi:MAG: hypothetical protein OXE96_08865 [Gemmatimonadetes bacterium]|nr:hypothetical protein [Gemmatimonadota bacterium]
MTHKVGDRHGGGARRGARRRGARLPWVVGLLISALGHVLLVVIYPFFSARGPELLDVPALPAAPAAEGMEVVRIVEVESVEVGDPDDPTLIQDPDEPAVTPEVPAFEVMPRVRFPGPYRSAAERLRIGEGDPRLWQPIDPALAAPSPQQLLELRLLALIEQSSDSALAEAERLAEAMDWTHTDDEGRRWGVSPGKIHLGDVEIPVPFGFGPPPDYNGDRADWAFRMTDIERAAGTLAARQSWKERVEVMRQRREERRAEEEDEKAGDPPVVKPDTTSIGPGRR